MTPAAAQDRIPPSSTQPPSTATSRGPGSKSHTAGAASSEVLAAQFAMSIAQRQAMVQSWLGGANDEDEDEDEDDKDESAGSMRKPSDPITETSSAGFTALPSSTVGLGSKRSKLDRHSVQVALNRTQYSAQVRARGGGGDLKNLANAAKALNSLKHKTGRASAKQAAAAREKEPSDDSSDESDQESRSRALKRNSKQSFFDAYRGQKKKKKHKK